jgi:hypothetical protein
MLNARRRLCRIAQARNKNGFDTRARAAPACCGWGMLPSLSETNGDARALPIVTRKVKQMYVGGGIVGTIVIVLLVLLVMGRI